MAWFVEELFLHRELIRLKGNVESEEFFDLLTVEAVLDMLTDTKQLTSRQRKNFDKYPLPGNKDMLHYVCDKIATVLGDKFTDEGYLEYLCTMYSLNECQLNMLRQYMRSSLQHKVLTKPFEESRAPKQFKPSKKNLSRTTIEKENETND